MQDITLSITHTTEYEQLLRGLQGGKTTALAVGLPPVSKAQLAAALHLETGRPVLLLTDDEGAVRRLADDLETFAEKHVLRVPERDFVMLGVESSSRQYEQARISALWHLAEGAPLAAGSVAALSQTCIPPQVLRDATFTLTEGENKPLAEITAALTAAGYQRCVQVEGAGQFAVRGGILDLFPPQEAAPVRVEFWGDDIDSMAYFDVGSQRRGARVETLTCLPCAETLPGMAKGGVAGLCAQLTGILKARRKKQHPDLEQNLTRDIERLREMGTLPAADKYLPLIYPQSATAFDYLPADTLILVDDTPRLREASKGFSMRIASDIEALTERGELPPSEGYALSFAQLVETLRRFACVRMDTFLNSVPELAPQTLVNFVVTQMNAYGGSLDMAAADIASYIGQGRAVAVLCASEMRCRSMYEALDLHDVPARLSPKLPPKGRVHIMEGSLSAGFELPTLDLTVITEGQIIARRARSKSRAKKTNRDRVKSYTDLTPGDLVVHEHHGIGRFVGMESITVDGSVRDFVKIAFAGTDFLYVPATSLDLISKYIGGGEPEKTKLSKLGGADWAKARTRAKAAAKQLAEGLLKLYAERAKLKGFAFPADDAWQQEFEESFPYDETDDQLRCVAEIKADMESDRPMDRLLCGDVGFGKTEVALRAVMKCILAGKQAAILVPTTVLARQHFLTAKSRFAGYPLKIELLSRYKTASEQKKILEQLKTGMIDLIIGTHKLFNKKIEFHDLGLLVIDEEQRFGVKHKESFKEMRNNVDVLTLSATPIPRTLNMAMSGIRDMSTIEEAPQDRQPVQTYVMEHDWGILVQAISKELRRGGQVFYLHNRVDTIDRCAATIQQFLPDATVVVAHGKMSEEQLSKVWKRLLDHEIDILVCTTIIETGVDVSNCNTLIIEDADRLGLSQLYQIRGRVGRSSRRAFAYLTVTKGKALTDVATKRLEAIREFTTFGSGFRIAMRDLEIRGAGNILGAQQHGHMEAVGYEMYLKMLSEAVAVAKGEKPEVQNTECLVDIRIGAHIPEDYIESLPQRIDIYKKIASVENEKDASDIIDELIDRFGTPPEAVKGLVDVSLLRNMAAGLGIREISQRTDSLLFYPETVDMQAASRLAAGLKGRVMLNAGAKPYLAVKVAKGEKPVDTMRLALTMMAGEAPPAK